MTLDNLFCKKRKVSVEDQNIDVHLCSEHNCELYTYFFGNTWKGE